MAGAGMLQQRATCVTHASSSAMWKGTAGRHGRLPGARNAFPAGSNGLNALGEWGVSPAKVRRAAGARSMYIQTTPTPNEHALKFVPGVPVTPNGTSVEFLSMRDAGNSPLARRLLVIEGVKGVFLGADFITVMKDPEVEWAVLKPELFENITVAFSNNEPVLEDHVEGQEVITDTTILPEDSEVVAMIKELLETRVKPAVAEDGGSIIYRGFEPATGVVQVELQGACSSCSSSSVTLKMGVQNMLMHYIPEVKSVEEVKSPGQEASEAALVSMEERLKDSGHLRS
ncbi:NFU1 iron-sulfur cluster scaffold-like, mitochondrial [Porphyridium purpureum]|uniref:NFU1 iron-sulfur cluster scaffold-like, mitochondrial n=1 Tax=Porphyridium purpureum TaxID=35688 RepID=A0A5J4Z0W8_PORPP|nr:NFU1 iron-sulfur cluster scaffold-like, mitochondrial [Porphyridium purpureum]|eukprot:POR0456..scf208_2